jgi:hypothetical protein
MQQLDEAFGWLNVSLLVVDHRLSSSLSRRKKNSYMTNNISLPLQGVNLVRTTTKIIIWSRNNYHSGNSTSLPKVLVFFRHLVHGSLSPVKKRKTARNLEMRKGKKTAVETCELIPWLLRINSWGFNSRT